MRKNIWLLCTLFCCVFPVSVSAKTLTYNLNASFMNSSEIGNNAVSMSLDDSETEDSDSQDPDAEETDSEEPEKPDPEEPEEPDPEEPPVLQDGTLEFTQEQDSYSTDKNQRYFFSYLQDEKTYDHCVVSFQFGQGFIPSTLNIGNWIVNDSNETVHIVLTGYDGSVEKYDALSGTVLSALESVGELQSVEISCDQIGIYDISDIIIAGVMGNVDFVYSSVSFDGYYENDLIYQDEAELTTKHIYYNLSTPEISFGPHTIGYNKDATITISNINGSGTAHMDSYSLTLKLPKSLILSEMYLPEMENAQIKAYLNGNEIESGMYAESGTITITIIPLASSFRQLSDIKFIVTNRTKAENSVLLNAKVLAVFSDYNDIRLSKYSNSVYLKEKSQADKQEENGESDEDDSNSSNQVIEKEEQPVIKENPPIVVPPAPDPNKEDEEKEEKKEKQKEKEKKNEDNSDDLLNRLLDNTKKLVQSVGNRLTTGTVEEVQAKTKNPSSEATTEVVDEVKDTAQESIKKRTNETVKNNRGVQSVLIIVSFIFAGILAVLFLLIHSLKNEEEEEQ